MSRQITHETKARISFIIFGIIVALLLTWLAASSILSLKATPESPILAGSITQETSIEDGQSAAEDIDWEYWKSVNPDIIGWVYIPDTRIDYPLVSAWEQDPLFYLSHDVYKDYNVWGCPYLDEGCPSANPEKNLNSVFSGHHMNDGSMFSDFANYYNESYAENHREIWVFTPTKTLVYKVVAVDCIRGSNPIKRTTFENMNDYTTYKAERLGLADITFDDAFDNLEAPMATFVTCSYNFNPANERTVVYAILEQSI